MRRLAALLIPLTLAACGDSGGTGTDDSNRVASIRITATSSASEPVDQQPFDRVLREPLRLVLPDGQIVEIPRPR